MQVSTCYVVLYDKQQPCGICFLLWCISQNPVLFFDSVVEYIIMEFFHIHIFHDLQATKIKITKIKNLRRAGVNIQLSSKLISAGKKSRKAFSLL